MNLDRAVRLANDSIDGGKAETGAFSYLLRREERFEYVLERLAVHACSGIAHPKQGVWPGQRVLVGVRALTIERHAPRLDRQGSAPRHRIPCVHGQVQQDLSELARVDPDRSEPLVQFDSELQVLPQQTGQHPSYLSDRRVYVHHARLEYLLPAEGKQLARESGRSTAR